MNLHKPKLSVVIASVNGMPIIGECLESLQQQAGVDEIEVVVANRRGHGVGMAIRENYPGVKLIEAHPQTPIPHLRALAFRETVADVVAVLEDHCIVEPDWARRMIEAQRGDYPVIGGSVENAACDRLADWAFYFCEYSQAMKPMPEGEVEDIVGNNTTYKREVLERFWHHIENGVWDSILHKHMRIAHLPLYAIPSITVHHKMSASLPWFITQKYHFARAFAGTRFDGSARLRRTVYGACAVFLPFILAQRIALRVWRKGAHRREFLLSFPILMLLLLSWGVGEAIGYMFGPGSSEAKVA